MSNGITIDLSQGAQVGLVLHADMLTLGGSLALDDNAVDYTARPWQTDQSWLVMDSDGVTRTDGEFSGALSGLSNSSTVTVGDLGLEGYDPSLELGRWDCAGMKTTPCTWTGFPPDSASRNLQPPSWLPSGGREHACQKKAFPLKTFTSFHHEQHH